MSGGGSCAGRQTKNPRPSSRAGPAGREEGCRRERPGRHTRLRNLALQGREVALLAVGAVVMFLVAGMIEGFFRQLVQDVGVRWTLAALTLVFWTWYFLIVGRNKGAKP